MKETIRKVVDKLENALQESLSLQDQIKLRSCCFDAFSSCVCCKSHVSLADLYWDSFRDILNRFKCESFDHTAMLETTSAYYPGTSPLLEVGKSSQIFESQNDDLWALIINLYGNSYELPSLDSECMEMTYGPDVLLYRVIRDRIFAEWNMIKHQSNATVIKNWLYSSSNCQWSFHKVIFPSVLKTYRGGCREFWKRCLGLPLQSLLSHTHRKADLDIGDNECSVLKFNEYKFDKEDLEIVERTSEEILRRFVRNIDTLTPIVKWILFDLFSLNLSQSAGRKPFSLLWEFCIRKMIFPVIFNFNDEYEYSSGPIPYHRSYHEKENPRRSEISRQFLKAICKKLLIKAVSIGVDPLSILFQCPALVSNDFDDWVKERRKNVLVFSAVSRNSQRDLAFLSLFEKPILPETESNDKEILELIFLGEFRSAGNSFKSLWFHMFKMGFGQLISPGTLEISMDIVENFLVQASKKFPLYMDQICPEMKELISNKGIFRDQINEKSLLQDISILESFLRESDINARRISDLNTCLDELIYCKARKSLISLEKLKSVGFNVDARDVGKFHFKDGDEVSYLIGCNDSWFRQILYEQKCGPKFDYKIHLFNWSRVRFSRLMIQAFDDDGKLTEWANRKAFDAGAKPFTFTMDELQNILEPLDWCDGIYSITLFRTCLGLCCQRLTDLILKRCSEKAKDKKDSLFLACDIFLPPFLIVILHWLKDQSFDLIRDPLENNFNFNRRNLSSGCDSNHSDDNSSNQSNFDEYLESYWITCFLSALKFWNSAIPFNKV